MIDTTIPVFCACGCLAVVDGQVVDVTRRCIVVVADRGWMYFDRATGEGMGGTRGRAVLRPCDAAALDTQGDA